MVCRRTDCFVVRLPSRRRARFCRFFVFVEAKRPRDLPSRPDASKMPPLSQFVHVPNHSKRKGKHNKSSIFGLRAAFRDPYRTFSPSEAALFSFIF